MKTSELTGDALNAVIKRIVLQDGLYTQDREIYTKPFINRDDYVYPANTSIYRASKVPPKFERPPTTGKFDPLNNDRQCVAIMNHYGVKTAYPMIPYPDGMRGAVSVDGTIEHIGATFNEAAMRVVVAMRLGDEVEL